jgi:hypothetical protein
MERQEIVKAYRRLYRDGLRAVQFSKPARYVLRDRLRLSFRNGAIRDFDPAKIENTVEFLKGAAREKGLEHKIVKSLMQVWFYEPHYKQNRWHG